MTDYVKLQESAGIQAVDTTSPLTEGLEKFGEAGMAFAAQVRESQRQTELTTKLVNYKEAAQAEIEKMKQAKDPEAAIEEYGVWAAQARAEFTTTKNSDPHFGEVLNNRFAYEDAETSAAVMHEARKNSSTQHIAAANKYFEQAYNMASAARLDSDKREVIKADATDVTKGMVVSGVMTPGEGAAALQDVLRKLDFTAASAAIMEDNGLYAGVTHDKLLRRDGKGEFTDYKDLEYKDRLSLIGMAKHARNRRERGMVQAANVYHADAMDKFTKDLSPQKGSLDEQRRNHVRTLAGMGVRPEIAAIKGNEFVVAASVNQIALRGFENNATGDAILAMVRGVEVPGVGDGLKAGSDAKDRQIAIVKGLIALRDSNPGALLSILGKVKPGQEWSNYLSDPGKARALFVEQMRLTKELGGGNGMPVSQSQVDAFKSMLAEGNTTGANAALNAYAKITGKHNGEFLSAFGKAAGQPLLEFGNPRMTRYLFSGKTSVPQDERHEFLQYEGVANFIRSIGSGAAREEWRRDMVTSYHAWKEANPSGGVKEFYNETIGFKYNVVRVNQDYSVAVPKEFGDVQSSDISNAMFTGMKVPNLTKENGLSRSQVSFENGEFWLHHPDGSPVEYGGKPVRANIMDVVSGDNPLALEVDDMRRKLQKTKFGKDATNDVESLARALVGANHNIQVGAVMERVVSGKNKLTKFVQELTTIGGLSLGAQDLLGRYNHQTLVSDANQ